VLQNSQNAVRPIFREKTKQATITDRCALKRANEVAVGSSPIDVAPRMIIRPLRLRAGKFVFSDAKRLLQHYLPQVTIRWRPLMFWSKPLLTLARLGLNDGAG
jgi:hypothetical protein